MCYRFTYITSNTDVANLVAGNSWFVRYYFVNGTYILILSDTDNIFDLTILHRLLIYLVTDTNTSFVETLTLSFLI